MGNNKVKIKNQIAYFPYLGFDENSEEITFDDVNIWKYSSENLKLKIPDQKVRKAVKQRLERNKTISGSSLDGMGIVSVGKADFRVLTQKEVGVIREIQFLLFISSLCENNIITENTLTRGNYNWTTADNFELIIQNFDPDKDYTGYEDGAIHQLLSGGWKVGEIEVRQPSFVHQPLNFAYDKEFAQKLWQLKTKKKRLYSKILRSLEIFFDAYRNSPHVSWGARMLLQTAAFAILLDFYDRIGFKDKIEDYCKLGNDKKDMRIRYKYEPGNSKTWEIRTVKGYWADRFYMLRNHIVHGHNIKQKEYYFGNKQRHFDIGLMFYILAIQRMINGVYKNKIFINEIYWDKTQKKFLWKRVSLRLHRAIERFFKKNNLS